MAFFLFVNKFIIPYLCKKFKYPPTKTPDKKSRNGFFRFGSLDLILSFRFVFGFGGEEARFVFSEKSLQLFLVAAKLLLAIRAIEALVACCREALGVQTVGDLPAQEERQRTAEQAIGVKTRDEYEGREHHCEIPIIDAAGGAATVLHEPHLEGAEEQNTNDVTDGVRDGDQDQESSVEDVRKIEDSEHGVEGKPDEGNERGRSGGLVHGRGTSFFGVVISFELLLTAHAFQP